MTDALLPLARTVLFVLGVWLVGYTFTSAVKTFVLPRAHRSPLTTAIFRTIQRGFNLRTRHANSYEQRDRIMALYAPTALLSLPVVWLFLTLVGFALVFWSFGAGGFDRALKISGSSLLTLGFEPTSAPFSVAASFMEAAIGLILVALLISYLPTIYGAFARREIMVTKLSSRAGTPPWGAEMIVRYFKYVDLDRLDEQWRGWEEWFADIDESHSSLQALAFFRSPQPSRSWVTAAGAILDAAALEISLLDTPNRSDPWMCLQSGIASLKHIAIAFEIDPSETEPDEISISRLEWDSAVEHLRENGVPLVTDLEKAWQDWAAWRSRYDRPLVMLATLTMAPYAPWSSDRSLRRVRTSTPERRPRKPEPARDG
jgi:hypothetical protein